VNTERLLEVVEILRDEVEKSHRVYELLDELIQFLRQGAIERAQSVKNSTVNLLSKAPSNYFTPSRQSILREIGGDKLVGRGLADRIKALLEDYRLSPKEAAQVFTEIHREVLEFNGFINNLRNTSQRLGLKPHMIPAGKCEIGVIYPKPEVIADLGNLVDESRDLDHALRTFMEIGGTPGSPKISQISSSDIAFFLTVAASVGLAISKCIEKILEFIQKKYEIEKIRLEVEEKKIGLEIAKKLRAQEKEVEDAGVAEASGIILKLYEGTDEGRRNELGVAANGAARFMVVQVQRGVIFEVAASNVTSKGIDIQKAQEEKGKLSPEALQLKEVLRLGGSMRELAARREQLALPEAANSGLKRTPDGAA
jgi:hypothetical protein